MAATSARLRLRRTASQRYAAGLVVVLTLLVPRGMSGQEELPPEGNRKWIFGLAGALIVGLPSYLADDFGIGGCSSSACFAPVAAAVGGAAGFMLGGELDRAAARKWVAGPKAELSGSSYEVPLVVDYMTAATEGVALLGETGIARANPVVGVTGTHAARGLLATAVAAEHRALIAASASALLAFDQNVTARGARRVFGEGGAAVAGDGGSRLVLGGEGTLHLLDLTGTGIDVTVTATTSTAEAIPARDLVWSASGVIWEVTGSRLVGRSGESLAEMGAAELPGPARALSVAGGVGVVAGGESGVSVLDLSDPTAPKVMAHYAGVRYAYDVELFGRRVFVAAGEQGLVTLDVSNPAVPVVDGVVGNLGEPYAVVVSGGNLYVLDRDNAELHVIPVGDSAAAPEH